MQSFSYRNGLDLPSLSRHNLTEEPRLLPVVNGLISRFRALLNRRAAVFDIAAEVSPLIARVTDGAGQAFGKDLRPFHPAIF
jgi:hypothetical protein